MKPCYRFILILLSAILILSACGPATPVMNRADPNEYIDMQDPTGYDLPSTTELLDELGIIYEIVPVPDGKLNTVLDVSFDGYKENGLIYIKKGSPVTLHANRPASDKIVYLTFDDGPTMSNTFDILDILDEYNAKATFFVLGNRIKEYDDRIVATVERGHEIGCHSYSHELDTLYATSDPSTLISELEAWERDMRSVIGNDAFDKMPKLFRFPGGSSSNGRLSVSEAVEYIKAVENKGYSVYDWTTATNDAAPQERLEGEDDVTFFIRSLSEGIKSAKSHGRPLIILMHDKYSTKEALRDILDYLVDEGYYFDLLSNCPDYNFVD